MCSKSKPITSGNMADLTEPMTADPAKHREDLLERLDALRRKETFCDVTVAANGKEFKAYKVVLAAASPFFLSLLENDMRERNEQRIEIRLEEATASVMEDVLQYIYTGNVSVTEESCHNLIATADYLLLPGLKTLAVEFLKEKVTVQNCVFNYYFASKYHCTELTEICCSVINLNFSDVLKTDDFLNLDMKQVMEWVSSDDVNVEAEEEVFTGIVEWVSHNRSERESCFPDLIRQVRLRPSSQDILLKKLVSEDLVTTNIECMNFVLRSLVNSEKNLSKTPRNCLKVKVEGIFVCGGRNALCYIPCVDKWYQMANMTFEHQNHAAIQYKDKVYIFSKQKCVDGHLRVAEYYISSTNWWGSIQTNFEYDEQFSTLAILNGYSSLYALTNSEQVPENTIFTYAPDMNKWEIKGDESFRSRWGACGVAHGQYLYIIGGTTRSNTTATGLTKVERFDPGFVILEEVTSLNEARHDAFGAAMNDRIYVAGGIQMREQRSILLNTCEVYNPSTNEWHRMGNLCVPRHSASMVCFSGHMYVIGGLKNTSKHYTTRELSVEMFDSETNEWKEKTTIPVANENGEERRKQIHYKACIASVHKDVLEKCI